MQTHGPNVDPSWKRLSGTLPVSSSVQKISDSTQNIQCEKINQTAFPVIMFLQGRCKTLWSVFDLVWGEKTKWLRWKTNRSAPLSLPFPSSQHVCCWWSVYSISLLVPVAFIPPEQWDHFASSLMIVMTLRTYEMTRHPLVVGFSTVIKHPPSLFLTLASIYLRYRTSSGWQKVFCASGTIVDWLCAFILIKPGFGVPGDSLYHTSHHSWEGTFLEKLLAQLAASSDVSWWYTAPTLMK